MTELFEYEAFNVIRRNKHSHFARAILFGSLIEFTSQYLSNTMVTLEIQLTILKIGYSLE